MSSRSRPQSQRDPVGEQTEGDAIRRFIEKFAMVMAGMGMQRMAARAFTAVLVSQQGSLTAGELARTLGVSPAAVSGAVRYLVQLGMVSREREPGSRSDHYVVREHMFYEMVNRGDSLYNQLADALEEGVDTVGADTPAGERVAETRDFFRFVAKALPELVERWMAERTAAR